MSERLDDMEIHRNSPYGLSTLDRVKRTNQQRTEASHETPTVPLKKPADRRTQPDRRRQQEAFDGPERRRRRSGRRSPSLLDARTRQPVNPEDRRGARLDTSV
ncbi:hypothetical protein [Marinobacter bohaiensis]|uniref:hypothetical protein n=1 Tax=Marinobacter bohaiensis TaxID=2201898 RepID=UPI0013A68AAF|nr:hypothetical protein [Marinobacter bohaiensis]